LTYPQTIGNPTLADGILDRLVHNAHRIAMRGESMRKSRGRLSQSLLSQDVLRFVT